MLHQGRKQRRGQGVGRQEAGLAGVAHEGEGGVRSDQREPGSPTGQEANGGKLPLQAVAAPPPQAPGMNPTARPLSEGGAMRPGQASLLGYKSRTGFWFPEHQPPAHSAPSWRGKGRMPQSAHRLGMQLSPAPHPSHPHPSVFCNRSSPKAP